MPSKDEQEVREMFESEHLNGLIQQIARDHHANLLLCEPKGDIVTVGVPLEIYPEWQEAIDLQRNTTGTVVVVFKSGRTHRVVVRLIQKGEVAMPRKPRKPKSQRQPKQKNKGTFPISANATIHGLWHMPCGSGNLVCVIWQNPGQPLMGRSCFDNHGRKQTHSHSKNSRLPEMISEARHIVGGSAAIVQRQMAQPMPVREKLGPLTVPDMVVWLAHGELRFVDGEITTTREDTRDPDTKRLDNHYWPQIMAMQWKDGEVAYAVSEAVVLAALHRERHGFLALPNVITTQPDCTEHHVPSDIVDDAEKLYDYLMQVGKDHNAHGVQYSVIGSDDTINTFFVKLGISWYCKGKLVGEDYHRLDVKRVANPQRPPARPQFIRETLRGTPPTEEQHQ